MHFRHSIYLGALPHGQSYLERFRLAAAASIAGIEMPDVESETEKREVAAAIAETGIAVHNLLPLGLWEHSLCSPEPGQRTKAVHSALRALESARRFGSETILLLGGPVAQEQSPAEVLSRFRDLVCAELLPAAEKLGIGIVIENVQETVFAAPSDFVRFIDGFASPRVRALLDVGNIHSGHAALWVDALGARIGKLHVKDFRILNSAGQVQIRRVGDGLIDWPAVRASLERTGFEGWASSSETREYLIGRALNRVARHPGWRRLAGRMPLAHTTMKYAQAPFAHGLLKDINQRFQKHLVQPH